jgi:hypothetical protein
MISLDEQACECSCVVQYCRVQTALVQARDTTQLCTRIALQYAALYACVCTALTVHMLLYRLRSRPSARTLATAYMLALISAYKLKQAVHSTRTTKTYSMYFQSLKLDLLVGRNVRLWVQYLPSASAIACASTQKECDVTAYLC